MYICMSYLFTHNFREPYIYSCSPRLSCICWLYSSRHPSWTDCLLLGNSRCCNGPLLKMKIGRGSHSRTRWRESVFLYYVETSNVEDLKRNPAGHYFGQRVGVGWVDEPSDDRRKHFQGTGTWGSIWTTAALYHHDWEAYTVSAV